MSAASKTTPEARPPFALVVDDEPANRDFLVRLLQQAHLDVHGAGSAQEALSIAKDVEHMALIVIDNKLPDMDGIDLLITLRQRYAQAHIVMATMLDERTVMTRAFEGGCDVFLVKPHGFMELFRRVQALKTLPTHTAGDTIEKDARDDSDDPLRRLIIDQYGPRPYRG